MREEELKQEIALVTNQVESVIVGKRDAIELLVLALLCDGHVLIEDVPGVGKTMMIRALAKAIGADFKRIQFTPDLLPSDVTGISIFNPKEGTFEFRPGPIFAHLVLADEINRTSPKTQAALLEAMEEKHITVDGKTRALPHPHVVMATQNPLEYEGTYPLPEAQLDRFLLKLSLGYPDAKEELRMLSNMRETHPIDRIEPVLSLSQLVSMQQRIKEVHVGQDVLSYLLAIVQQTRVHSAIALGVSPRGSLALMRASQAYAFMHNRSFVIPDDVKRLVPFVCSHRMLLHQEAKFQGVNAEQILHECLLHTPVPLKR